MIIINPPLQLSDSEPQRQQKLIRFPEQEISNLGLSPRVTTHDCVF